MRLHANQSQLGNFSHRRHNYDNYDCTCEERPETNILYARQVYRELEGYLDTRVSEEARAVEASMAMARECIDSQSAIEHEWRIQVGLVTTS